MKAQELMTASPACCTPESTAYDAARMMAEFDCGMVPVVENAESMRLVGVVTDRDLAVRGLAEGRSADAQVRDLMTRNVWCCSPGDDLKRVAQVMADNQVRRVPIVDAEGCCVGIIAQADLARAAEQNAGVSDREVAMVVEQISEPPRDTGAGATPGRQPDVRF